MRATTRVGLLLCAVLSASVTFAEDPPRRAIRRSDVVFMYDNPKLYEAYGCTVLGWAGWGDAQHIEKACRNGVRLFSTSVGFLTEGRRAIDFSDDFLDAACRDLSGEPFIVPWLWDHKHKGQSYWWWCTNSPLYEKFLESRLEDVVASGANGLHIDDYRGTSGSVTWLPGGFCRHCMAGFREYLGKNVPKEKLAELGIEDLTQFDYRQFLLDRGVKPEEYNNQRSSLPLAAEFYDFQVKTNTAFVAAYHQKAKERTGKPLTLCVNSGLSNPQAIAIAPHLSYFCCEVNHKASRRAGAKHPIYIYKLADGLDRPVTSTASGQDWAYIHEHKLYGLVRSWAAMSYAFGHNFMAPHRQWCYTKEKGTHWLESPAEEFAWLYQFVRGNARLLDGYEAVAPVAVVYDNATRREGRGDIEPICIALAQRNIPFTVVVAGDNWLDYRLDAERLRQFQVVIVPEKLDIEGQQLVWPNDEKLAELVPAPVIVEGSQDVMAVVRAMPNDDSAPVAVHLLNRSYDGEKDAMIPQKNFVLRLRRDLLPGRQFTQAILRTPRADAIPVELTTDQTHLSIKIPALSLWGVLELITDKPQ